MCLVWLLISPFGGVTFGKQKTPTRGRDRAAAVFHDSRAHIGLAPLGILAPAHGAKKEYSWVIGREPNWISQGQCIGLSMGLLISVSTWFFRGWRSFAMFYRWKALGELEGMEAHGGIWERVSAAEKEPLSPKAP